jgi:orotate phosphoribosyltransferase
VQHDVLSLLAARKGHFLLESGHHGDLWLDLELLCLRPNSLRPLAAELANRLIKHDVEMICAPLVEGAFVGLLVAAELNVEFSYAERFARRTGEEFFTAGYRLPDALRCSVYQKRVAIVNDVINAGSAVRGTFENLKSCGATPIAIGALLVLGTAAAKFAAEKNVVLENIASLPNALWSPAECPLCASGRPLEDIAGFHAALDPGPNAH